MNHIIGAIRESGLFNEEWYLAQHPDVGALGLDPIIHYVEIGAFLGRDPSPEFSTKGYLLKYADVQHAGVNPLYHYVKWGRAEGRTAENVVANDVVHGLKDLQLSPANSITTIPADDAARNSVKKSTGKTKISPFSVEDLDIKLWGGFSRYAIPELENWKNSSRAKKSDRVSAAWFLSRWFYVAGDYQTALENISLARVLRAGLEKEIALLEVQCLIKLGRYSAARKTLTAAIEKLGSRPDLLLLGSTIKRGALIRDGKSQSVVDRLQLEAINEIYVGAGIAPLELKDKSKPLHFSNLTATANPVEGDLAEKVTILIPAYNAESTIHIALDSLLAQTWHNIEIVVIDDCSTDSTKEVVAGIAQQDPRVKLISKDVNEGSYPSRNRGLREATGDYIMVHDSDDWSHPQKIELQVKKLAESTSAVAVMSHWVRVEEYLEAVGSWLPKGTLFDLNFSSLMVKRDVMERLGGWDEARVSGDAEFRTRLMNIYGQKSVVKTKHSQLLSLSLSREDSLTRSKSTHLRSLLFGMRWQYRDAYQYWHQKQDFLSTATVSPGAPRQFPLPLGNRPKKVEKSEYDVIVVCDFVLRGGAFVSTFNYIKAACAAGKRVAVAHWRKYELNPHSSLNPKLYELCVEKGIDILTPGDVASTEFLIVGYPAILQHMPDSFPVIVPKHLIVVVNQFASRLYDGSDQQYDPLVARSNLLALFGEEGVWVPISALVKKLMKQDSRYPSPHARPWYPMIETDSWCDEELRWRGGDVARWPIVGRHGRDAYTKWPSDIQTLRDAYGLDKPATYRFLGGANHALKQLQEVPANWEILPFDHISVRDFLKDLDFYIHYPHEMYIEEFGRAVMEAMAIGIPAILPHSFRRTFGDAAVYADSQDVWKEINRMWKNKEEYLDRAKKGRDFVLRNCSLQHFEGRLSYILKEKYIKKAKQRKREIASEPR